MRAIVVRFAATRATRRSGVVCIEINNGHARPSIRQQARWHELLRQIGIFADRLVCQVGNPHQQPIDFIHPESHSRSGLVTRPTRRSDSFSRIIAGAIRWSVGDDPCCQDSSSRTPVVNFKTVVPDPAVNSMTRRTQVSVSHWVNQRYPPVQDLLSAHDVARLTRRPRWLLVGLSLIRRFPRRCEFRGRPIGWHRSEVLSWMARGVCIAPTRRPKSLLHSPRVRRRGRQIRLPLDCSRAGMSEREVSRGKRRKSVQQVGNRT